VRLFVRRCAACSAPAQPLGLSGNHGQVRGMLGAGRSFGERALLLNEPRAATIQVRAPCKYMRLIIASREPKNGARAPDNSIARI
jgi:hypothetical protein